MIQGVNKTILDILLEKNRITREQAAKFGRELTNSQIEDILRQQALVPLEDISKAYAVVYDLPFVRLENYGVSPDAFQIIPRNLIQEYQIIAFEKSPNGKIKVAVGNPSKVFASKILEEIKNQQKAVLDLYITMPESIATVLASFPENEAKPKLDLSSIKKIEGNAPVNVSNYKSVDFFDSKISYETISKFPLEVSQKYHMVVFDAPSPDVIKVAVSNPLDKKVQEIIDFVSKRNNIKVEEYVATEEAIDEIIKKYYRKPTSLSFLSNLAGEFHKNSPKKEEKEDEKPSEPIINKDIKNFQPQPVAADPVTQNPIKQPIPEEEKPVEKEETEDSKKIEEETLKSPALDPDDMPVKPSANMQFVKKPEEEVNKGISKEDQEDNLTKNKPVAAILPENHLDEFLGLQVTTVEEVETFIKTGNVPKILGAAISLAGFRRASDIHIEPEEDNVRIRFRVDGILKNITVMPTPLLPAIISRIKILSRLKIDEQRIPQDGRFAVISHAHEIDLRISILPTVRGEKAALRLLDKSQNIYGLKELGFTGRNLQILEENIIRPYGTILVTGPTGSGKSTTLYSILKQISSPKVNVITLEDPVEYEMSGINQCQIRPKIGFTFAEGLRSVLRQDPNIIMVGEIRDSETASLATHAALTGHLVLTSLHTNDAPSALPRLINMGIEPFLITSALNVIVGQRLVRKLCQKCKKELVVPDKVMADIEKELENLEIPKPLKFYEGAGCSECDEGFKGRIGIYEVLAMTDEVEDLAVKSRPASEIADQAIKDGMITMKQDGLLKALAGVTTISEVFRVTLSD